MISLIWKYYADPVTVVPSKWISPLERLVAFPSGVAGKDRRISNKTQLIYIYRLRYCCMQKCWHSLLYPELQNANTFYLILQVKRCKHNQLGTIMVSKLFAKGGYRQVFLKVLGFSSLVGWVFPSWVLPRLGPSQHLENTCWNNAGVRHLKSSWLVHVHVHGNVGALRMERIHTGILKVSEQKLGPWQNLMDPRL